MHLKIYWLKRAALNFKKLATPNFKNKAKRNFFPSGENVYSGKNFSERFFRMKIAVVGGAGYIGSHTVLELLLRGHEVRVFDNLSSGRLENVFEKAPLTQGDILNPKELDEFFEEFSPEGVVHLAAFKAAGESMLSPEKYSENNIVGSMNLLNACSKAQVKYFVFSSSAAVYGAPNYLPIDENHPKNPENYYGYTKLSIEGFLEWYSKLRNIRYAILRYFNAAGYDYEGRIRGLEKNPANLIPVVMEALMGIRKEVLVFGDDYETPDGTGVRDYIHVTDLAYAHAAAFDYLKTNDKDLTVNLGTSRGASVLEVIRTAELVSGRRVPYKIVGRRPGDPALLTANSARASKLLQFSAKNSDLKNILSTTWKVYLANDA